MTNITELTKEQKIAAYKHAIDRINDANTFFKFACIYIKEYAVDNLGIESDFELSGELVERLFPEFWAQKPKQVIFEYCGWWDNFLIEPRIKALQNAIKLLEN